MLEPGEGFKSGGKPKSMIAFARSRLRGTGPALLLVALVALISVLTGLLNPAFSRVFLDRLLTSANPEWLTPFMIGLGAISLAQVAATWIKGVYSVDIDNKLSMLGSAMFMWKVLRLPMEFFSQRMAGDIQQRKQSNATIAATLVNTFAPLVLDTCMMVFYLIVMVRYSLPLAAVGVAATAINAGLARAISRKRVNITRVQMRDEAKLYASTISGLEMIETIKSSGAENGYFERWAGYQASANAQKAKYAKISQYLGIVPQVVSACANLCVMVLGVWLTLDGKFTIGMIMAFQGFLSSFSAPAEALISAGQTLQEMRTEMERIEDVLKYPEDAPRESEELLPDAEYDKLKGALELKGVTFGYSRLAPPIIEDFSMSVRPGESVAIVGASGCGKSTISGLISGLYKPWSGEILFDGKRQQEIDRSIFTGSLAVVNQDIILFEDTIANNIKMWDNSIEDFEMIMAARDVQLHDEIMQRDEGYQYRIQEGGKDFSVGERQRLEIARVLAQDPTIIIMDEATSALDAVTEFKVVKSFKDRGITCIVMAHRLSAIKNCDEIIVLDKGKVIERGTHDELFALNGAYTRLVSSE